MILPRELIVGEPPMLDISRAILTTASRHASFPPRRCLLAMPASQKRSHARAGSYQSIFTMAMMISLSRRKNISAMIDKAFTFFLPIYYVISLIIIYSRKILHFDAAAGLDERALGCFRYSVRARCHLCRGACHTSCHAGCRDFGTGLEAPRHLEILAYCRCFTTPRCLRASPMANLFHAH